MSGDDFTPKAIRDFLALSDSLNRMQANAEAWHLKYPGVSAVQEEINRMQARIDSFNPVNPTAEALRQSMDRFGNFASATRQFPGLENFDATRAFYDKAMHSVIAAQAAYRNQFQDTSVYQSALKTAEWAASFELPAHLETFRSTVQENAARLSWGAFAHRLDSDRWYDRRYVDAFNSASAVARSLQGGGPFDVSSHLAVHSFAGTAIDDTIGYGDYRGILDAAGLILPRWPQRIVSVPRFLTERDLEERQKKRLGRYRQSRHVARAKSLVHKHEGYLRSVIDAVMAEEYGDDWCEDRLPLCGEKGVKLLKDWKRKGANHPLELADYAHYLVIITHPEHFQKVFSLGFADADVLAKLINDARKLRANSHHPGHEFTTSDLRDLRLVWRALLKGLQALDSALYGREEADEWNTQIY